jgi:hypothetical protein
MSIEQQGLRLGLQHHRQDGRQGDVLVVRALVVAPAHVHAHAIGRYGHQRMVQRLHVQLDPAQVGVFLQILVHHVPAQAEIGRVQLQDEARIDDGVVLVAQRQCQRLQVGIVVGVVLVGLEELHDTG